MHGPEVIRWSTFAQTVERFARSAHGKTGKPRPMTTAVGTIAVGELLDRTFITRVRRRFATIAGRLWSRLTVILKTTTNPRWNADEGETMEQERVITRATLATLGWHPTGPCGSFPACRWFVELPSGMRHYFETEDKARASAYWPYRTHRYGAPVG